MRHPCPYCRGRATVTLDDPADYRAVRVGLGLSVKLVAARLSVHPTSVSNFERCRYAGPHFRDRYRHLLEAELGAAA